MDEPICFIRRLQGATINVYSKNYAADYCYTKDDIKTNLPYGKQSLFNLCGV
jgi:hypothetical protein